MTSHRRSSVGTKIPSLTSPLVTHYCLTLTTTILALTGFVGALFAALSCEFMQVYLTDVPSTSAAAAGWIDSMPETNSTDWYYNELMERQEDHSSSVGIFCPNSIITQDVNDGRLKLSQAFLTTALVLGAILLNVTCLISTILSNTERAWNFISINAGLGFLCELPVFFVMDSPLCTDDFTCSLGRGSFGLFCSMTCYLVIALLTQWKEPPDWKEEYELWRLMKRNQEQKTSFVGQGDVEMGLQITQKGDAVERDDMPSIKPDNKQVTNVNEEVLPPLPPLPKTNEAISPAAARENERKLFRQTRKAETSRFVGTYINVDKESTTPDRAITEERNISPITLVTLSKDGSSAVETGAETEVHKNTEVSHEVLNNSMELINQQLQKTLELKRNLREQQKQSEEQQKRIDDVSQISFLDYNDADANAKTFQQSPLGKDNFDHIFYADMPDLSSIIASNDDDDVSRFNPPEENLKAHEKFQTVKNVRRVPIKPPANTMADDGSLAASARSNSTRSALGRSAKHVNQSMRTIFRIKNGKENNKNSVNSKNDKEMIQEPWMLEETSLGRSNSDDLLFLVERNRGDGASMTSRRSKVTVLSWASRCKSPDKPRGSSLGSENLVSPTPPQVHRVVSPCNRHMPMEFTAESNTKDNGIAVVSPEKDDPGVEMYPSDASMSTLSLPTASDCYTTEDDYRSKQSRRDGSSCSRGFFSGTDSESEEMSIIIAGVQRMNRKTCGKPSHLSKRRRRRRRRKSSSRSGCSISEYSSHSGSLLDEVIDEEGPLNESGEPIPAVIDASPVRPPTKKSKSPRKKSNSLKKKVNRTTLTTANVVSSGYESGYAYRSDFSDDESKRTGYCTLSENEESTSSRAARARRNRLLSKRQIHIDPDSLPDPTNPAGEAVVNASPSNYSHDDFTSCQSQKRDPSYSYHDGVHSISKNTNMGVCFGSTSQRGNTSWQARNSRMSRLRMQRQASESVLRESEKVTACGSDEGSI